ncbi:MAG: POTRA domain-containing protein [Tepidisphaeraceae bacterium]
MPQGQEDYRVKPRNSRSSFIPIALATAVVAQTFATADALAQTPPTPGATGNPPSAALDKLNAPLQTEIAIASGQAGRKVESIEVRGNSTVATTAILNVVRTRVGEPLDPATVQEDYQRIYDLRRFSNVEAQLQPTPTGVVVTFIVSEQKLIRAVAVRGNNTIPTPELLPILDMKANEGIDNFRIALAKRQLRQYYKSKNYPFADITTDADALAKDGTLIFVVNEGPNVRVRNIDFIGNHTFPEDRLKNALQTKTYFFIIRPGTFDEDTVDDDVARVRDYYRSKGFFDAKVGRRLVFSPDQTEVQIEFVVEEGQRYRIDRVTFVGNASVPEQELRKNLKLTEGEYFDEEVQTRDVRRIVDAYGPSGFVYQPDSNNPDYLQIRPTQRYRLEAGKIELVYQISEGKQFRVGNIEVRGNSRTQDKVIRRAFERLFPGQLWNAPAIARAREQLQATQLFNTVKVTAQGDKPEERDVLVEVEEAKTAMLTFGGGVSSNGGVFGSVTYTEKNFDIGNWPSSFSDITSQRGLTGAGQTFKLSLEPGTQATNASVSFTEPYLFDLPYSLTTEAYLRDRQRENYDDTRLGGRATFGKRFDDLWRGTVGLRGESVRIHNIGDQPIRAYEIMDAEGSHILTSIQLGVRRDSTNPGSLKYEGSSLQASWESAGLIGGDYTYQRLRASYDVYTTLYEDLIDRKTVLAFYTDAGYIIGDAPFFEKFYGGGSPPSEGALRGFRYRGVSPRSGPANDPVGGKFLLTGTAELSFPLYGDNLRGVVFTDIGTVEDEFTFGTIRSSLGFGFRINLPVLGQVPIALDFAWPITRDKLDDESFLSFSLGFVP